MSFIDTVAYLEFDDLPKNFQQWLDQYTELNGIELTSSELWELRNSLLHMTNPDSRKVLKGEVSRLFFYVGTLPKGFPRKNDEAKYFELMSLIKVVMQGVQCWGKSYNTNRSKIKGFIDRYNRVLSDARSEILKIE